MAKRFINLRSWILFELAYTVALLCWAFIKQEYLLATDPMLFLAFFIIIIARAVFLFRAWWGLNTTDDGAPDDSTEKYS